MFKFFYFIDMSLEQSKQKPPVQQQDQTLNRFFPPANNNTMSKAKKYALFGAVTGALFVGNKVVPGRGLEPPRA
jgi:hypothetical protein